MIDPQLSKHFWLSEFTRSQTAARLKIPNNPSSEAIENLTMLAKYVLQPIRDRFDRALVISSGYRSPILNSAIGGSALSQHCLGEAADFSVPGIDHLTVARWIEKNLFFDQLILEYWVGGNSGWIHVSYHKKLNRKECLTINRNGTYGGFPK